VIGATFGLARAVPILFVHRAGDPSTLRGVIRGVHSQGRAARRVALGAIVSLVMLAVAAGAS
jgi:hypothetical protein